MTAVPHPCPDGRELAAFFENAAGDTRAEHIRDHIDECDDCIDALVALKRGSRLGGVVETTRETAEIPLGTRVGHFELRALLGAGNLGRVYSARDTRLGRDVALKLLGSRCDSPSWADRLVAEAHAMARIRHRNVCTVHEVGRDGEVVYVAMEKIDGTTLRHADLTAGDRLTALIDAARGLQAAHEQGVIHRDLKPDNIMIENRYGERRVVVCDFGLASASSAVRDHARRDRDDAAAALIGSPAYMAPEQLAGAPVTRAADIWAFGVTAWELLTGTRPFDATTLDELRAQQRRPLQWPRQVSVASAVRDTIVACLSYESAARPATAADLARRLTQSIPARGRLRWKPAALAFAAAVAMAAIGLGWRGTGAVDSRRAVAADYCGELDHAGWPVDRAAWTERAATADVPRWVIDRVAGRIDARAEQWSQQRRAVCDGDDGDPVRAPLWAACRRSTTLVSAQYLDSLLSWPSSDYERVPSAFDELPPVTFCSSPEGLRSSVDPTASPAQDSARDIRRKLAAAELLYHGGADAAEVSRLLQLAREQSKSVGDDRLAAEVAFAAAAMSPAKSTIERDRQWRQVVALAEGSGDARTGARAWLALADLWTATEPENRSTTRALEQSDWAIQRLGDPSRLRSGWHRAKASYAWKTGDLVGANNHFAAAIEAADDDPVAQRTARLSMAKLAWISEDHERTRALYEQVLADPRTSAASPASRAAIYSAYAEILYQQGNIDAGLRAIATARRLALESFEPIDPIFGDYTLVRGMLELERGEAKRCLATVDEALAILEPAYGRVHSSVGAALNLRASAHGQLGDHLAALATARRAHELYTRLYGESHESAIFAALQVAENLSAVDRLTESRDVFEHTLGLARKAMGESHSLSTSLRSSLAGVLDRLGDEQRAVTMGEAALQAIRASQSTPPYVGQAEHTLADILADNDPPRALALARAARDKYGDDPFWARERRQVERLIRTLSRHARR